MWVWERRLSKSCHKIVVQISFLFQNSLTLSKVSQFDSCFYVFFSHDEGLNWKTFDKDGD